MNTKKLTPEIHRLIVIAIRDGFSISSASEIAGLYSGTVYSWLSRGRKEQSGLYAALAADIDTIFKERQLKKAERLEQVGRAKIHALKQQYGIEV